MGLLSSWRDERGAIGLIGAVAIMGALMLLALVFDGAYLFARREALKRALDYSNMAVYREINVDRLADGQLYIDVIPGEDTFREFVARNMKLDGGLNPLGPESMAAGQVEIVDFEIYNPERLPTFDGFGNLIDEVAVYSKVRVPVRPIFIGLFREVDLYIAITTDIPEGIW